MPSPIAARRGRSRALVIGALGVALLAAGCSGDDSPPATAEPASPEEFTGDVDDFYVVPDPLPHGEPGELIRVQDLGEAGSAATVRVMYHSRDAEDRDRAVTGIVTYPTAPAPAGGWPVLSWAHGTSGLVSKCAPSREGGPAPAFGVEGVHVATDYIGLGPVGEIHPYLSGPSEGNSVIDAVRAARNLSEAHAGTRWLAIGHSQGGHAALFAGERADDYAPELELLGTVALAPAAELAETYGPLDEVVARIVGVMALYGAAAEHPDIDFDEYAGPEVEAAAEVLETECLDEIINAFVGIPGDTFYESDPLETEPTRSIFLEQNDPGQRAADTPLLLVSGTADERVNIERVRDLFDRLCDTGQVTELVVVDGANHGSVVPRTSDQVQAWLGARLASEAPTDSCAA